MRDFYLLLFRRALRSAFDTLFYVFLHFKIAGLVNLNFPLLQSEHSLLQLFDAAVHRLNGKSDFLCHLAAGLFQAAGVVRAPMPLVFSDQIQHQPLSSIHEKVLARLCSLGKQSGYIFLGTHIERVYV